MPVPLMDPAIVGAGVKLKTTVSQRRQSFQDSTTIAAAQTPQRLDTRVDGHGAKLIPVHRHSDITVGYLDISFGLEDDPIDELVLWMLVIHPDTLTLTGDDFQNFLDSSFWTAGQNWRLGDATGWIQTLTREQSLIGQEAIFTDALLKQDSYHIGLIAASTVTSAIFVTGTVSWTEILYQRSWPSRNSSEWAGWGFGMDDENYGQFGS